MKYFRIDNFTPYCELFSKLSNREIEVLTRSCSGLDRNEIAVDLNISVGTVNMHLNNAMKKYERESYADLRALFYFKINNEIISCIKYIKDNKK